MSDPNLVVSTNVKSARLEFLGDEEIRKLSCCRVVSPAAFAAPEGSGLGAGGSKPWGGDATGAAAAAAAAAAGLAAAVPGGVHDSRMGVFDGRETCGTCGASGSCPGHIGHIELELPALQPILMPSLVKLLKGVCLECRRLRLPRQQKGLEAKRFQLLQLLLLKELQLMDSAVTRSSSGNNGGDAEASKRRSDILKIFAAVDAELSARMQQEEGEKQQLESHVDSGGLAAAETGGDEAGVATDTAAKAAADSKKTFLLQHIARDLSGSSMQVSAWRAFRSRVLQQAAAVTRCSHCGVANAVSVHLAPKGSGVELRWPWQLSLPYSGSSFFGSLFHKGVAAGSTEAAAATTAETRVRPDEGCLKYSRTGKAIGCVELQGFQLYPLLQTLFSFDDDRLLLNYVFPMTIQLGPSVFFQQALAVAANRFRPPTAAAARGLGGRGGGGQLLHPRTQQLQDILRLNEKLRFALNVLKHPNPLEALKDPTQWAALFTGATDKQQQQQQQQQLAPEQQQLLQEFVEQHAAGGGKWLSTYALQLQLKLNEIVDNTRAEKPQAAPPGIRQWMERKAGAIRQRMQGKRVNYAARTVLAPDGLLAPNEVAVPLEFAMKLSVPEAVTAFNASQLSQMIRNGPNKHPGALALQDDKGNTFNLEFMSQSARAAKALELEAFAAAGTSDGSVFKVYRHLKDGDVVLMNRQPSLHRLSLMAHFVKVAKPMTREFHVNTFIEAAGLRRKDGSYRQVTQSLLKKRIQQQQQQEEGEQQPQAAAAAAAAAAKAEKEIAERVFRINFVNCSSYNADFDGDEMNLHVPQDAVARSEASQIVNADSQFTVPKNGDLVRGLIQDYCLAGALMTGRDTFLDVHSYQTLVYVGLERYLGSQGGGVRITLDRSKPLESSFAISSAAATCSSNLGNIVTVPPAVLWPKRLWTGKQVITTVLKTLVDGFARSRLRRCVAGSSSSKRVAEVLKGYRGINLESKSKTPGDAWGGAEDGDKEEACVIIRDSELLQGVFDKNQFGSSSGGLLHCVYLLLGGRAASMLLQCLSALFSCFLKMHGATTSPADFVLRTEGMQQREALIKKVVEAGTFLQEHFLWRLSSHLGCPPDEAHQRLQQRVAAAKATRTAPAAAATSAGGDAGAAGTGTEGGAAADWKAEAAAAAAAAFESGGGEAGLQRRKHALLKMAAAAAATATAAAGGSEDGSEPAAVDAAAAAGVLAEKLSLARLADAAAELLDGTQQQKQKQQQPQLNPWLLLRQKQLPLAASGIRPTAAAAAQQLRQLLQMLQRMQGMPQQRRELLLLLSSSPLLQEQLPRVAKLLQTQRLLPLHMQPSSCNSTSSKTEGANDCIYEQLKFPPPNVVVALPDGGSIEGSTRYLRPQLYHPSWLWQHQQQPQSAAAAFASGSFESPERYVLQSAAAAAAATATKQRVLLSPSIVTQERLRVLLQRQFKGRLSAFDELLDSFFMGFMGKVSSQSTDIMSGRSFLYRFPRNGFASMIKTGAKGSNVNYAMICVFLGQQSLEGRRVQPMSSGKSLPAFAPADFGSLARGFVLSSFLTGLREEEFYFHCMAGREGLIDTAVKTAKSGYLQRSLIKSLESLHLAYDGSVRDADGSILQFVYADDAMDPANANALKNMQLLTGNPYLLKWFNKPPPQVELSVHRNVSAYSRCKFGSKKEGQATEKDKEKDRDKQMERYLSAMEAQPFNSPLSAVGATNYLFEQNLKEVVASACEEYARTRRWLSFSSSKKQQQQEQQDYRAGLPAEELELLLRIAFHRGCMQPGEAVGVIAAQSIGEPATQMTLNTFHLAGHGAANVTMGIPRLRELLQLGAKTKTPQIIIPIKRGGDALGDRVKDRIALENAHAALRGFKTIRMEDFVHAVGVEANVYYQGPDSVNSFPEARPVGSRSAFSSRLYWEYEVSVQLEPLQHFCSVVRQFKPDDLLLLVLNKVIRPLLKKARKMAVASVSQYEFSEAAELQSDVQQLYRAFILKERLKSQWERRGAVKDILRSGNIACESGAGDAALEGEATSSKTQNTSAATNRGHAAAAEEDTKAAEDHDEGGNNKQKQRRKKNEEQEEEEGSVNSADSGHEEDEDDDEEDEEQEEADEEDDDDERQQQQQQQGDSSASDTEGSSRGSEAEDDDDNNNVNSSTTEKKEKKEKGVKGVKREPSAEIEDPQPPEKRIKQEQQQQQQGGEERLLDLAEVLRGKRFDRTLGVFVEEEKPASESKDKSLLQADTYSRPQLAPSPFEPDAVWSSPAAFNKMAPLDLESAAILHDLKICRKTWRVVVKFGWPVDKCPYRIELLPLVKGLVEKVTLQQPQGVSNPRIVQGAGCTTGSPMELHCSGSNLQWLHRLKETAVDHNRLQTNDVLAVLKFYGIEAARALFLRELSAVFGAYGIQVHSAHLGLVADFVTRDGNIIPFNRLGIQNSNSPFLQMAFETSFKFLTEACERAAVDDLQSPSAALIVGSPATIGSQQSQLLAVLPDFTDS